MAAITHDDTDHRLFAHAARPENPAPAAPDTAVVVDDGSVTAAGSVTDGTAGSTAGSGTNCNTPDTVPDSGSFVNPGTTVGVEHSGRSGAINTHGGYFTNSKRAPYEPP